MTALAPRVRLGGQPGFEDPLGSARGHVQEPREATAIVDGRQIQDDGDVPVPMRGVAPHVSTLWAAVAAHAHVQDRGVPPVGYVSQAPDHRVAYDAFAPTLSAPPVLTHYLAGQDGPIASYTLARHFQAQVIQACEGAQVRAIKGSIRHVEVFRMDGVGTPIIGRPRPLPGHDTPNPAYHPHTLNYEEPFNKRCFLRRPGAKESKWKLHT